jgi:hypothetical protein
MKFNRGANANMTSLRGEITTTFSELCAVFGEPDVGPNADLDKTTCEWHLKFEDGTIATIYDWKTGYTPRGVYDWHIGGYPDSKAVELVTDLINLHRDPLVKMVKNYEPQ